jgi:hypothetical protein
VKDKKRRASDKEQGEYGKTPKGRPVNMEVLEQLQGMLGYSRPLVALSLIQASPPSSPPCGTHLNIVGIWSWEFIAQSATRTAEWNRLLTSGN